MPDSVRVTIFNQSYSLLASGEEPGRVEELAHRVDDLMQDIASKGGNIDSTRVAVLACLHLADRLQAAEEDLAKLRDDVSSKAREFSLLLDEAIGEEESRSPGVRESGE